MRRGEGSIAVLHRPREGLTEKLMFEQRPKGLEEEHFLTEGTARAKALRWECVWHI